MAMRGILLEGSLLGESVSLEKLLTRLAYSNLHVMLLFTNGQDPSEKVDLLKQLSVSEFVKVVSVDANENVLKAIKESWPVQASHSVFVASTDGAAVTELTASGWNILYSGQGVASKEASTIQDIDDVFAALAELNKKAFGVELLVVGHVMKWSREKDFLKRRMLPSVPTSNDLVFVPLRTDRPMETQLDAVDIILHKATDEIVSVTTIQTPNPAERIQYSDSIKTLQRYIEEHPGKCIVDPIDRLAPILDRSLTREVLNDLEDAKVSDTTVVRAPRSVEVKDLEEPHLTEAVSVGFPTIVKTMMACGTNDAHTMAVVFKKEGYVNLAVPLPAVVQEYVDHGSCVYKFYIIGDKVMHSCRRSMPNAASMAVSDGSSGGMPALVFDSLKSMPSSFEGDGKLLSNTVVEGDGSLDVEAVEKAAVWLRKKLGLSIIGFDIVVQVGTKDHVMVDVNYFPSFKDVSDKESIPAFWATLRNAHASKTAST
ncbi:inositol-tetrakisphosphate 1-kinase 6 [Physcomitrium patens]|nr:inositol-tetrakisphosphate 1-kinase 6-like [Physcomitrium patens]PNR46765.1 hypothetical protein PHYPA_013885 [Physcomitrium patens]|eukprot:XP_024386761.1 inositol-tetrakisphosphate 1-kinase 6-like [Physcomitrella patens]